VNGTPNFEAHNTLLDILTQGGLLAVVSLVWLVGATFLLTYRTRLDGLTVLLCGLTIFSIFHLIVRHPAFWFAIAICLVAAEGRKASLTRQWS
jgi:O-antigen ligase